MEPIFPLSRRTESRFVLSLHMNPSWHAVRQSGNRNRVRKRRLICPRQTSSATVVRPGAVEASQTLPSGSRSLRIAARSSSGAKAIRRAVCSVERRKSLEIADASITRSDSSRSCPVIVKSNSTASRILTIGTSTEACRAI